MVAENHTLKIKWLYLKLLFNNLLSKQSLDDIHEYNVIVNNGKMYIIDIDEGFCKKNI